MHTDTRERIIQIREHFGLSRKDLSREIGMSLANISRIEAGKVEPSDALLNALLVRFAVNPDWIKTGDGEMLITPERYIAEGIRLFGAQKFSEGLGKVLKDRQFLEFQALVSVNEMANDNIDENLRKYIEYILKHGLNEDERKRTWLMVQLEKAFPEVLDKLKKK